MKPTRTEEAAMYNIYLVWADGTKRREGRAKERELAEAMANRFAELYEGAEVVVRQTKNRSK